MLNWIKVSVKDGEIVETGLEFLKVLEQAPDPPTAIIVPL